MEMDAIRLRAHSSPELMPPSIEHDPVENHNDDRSLEGIATNVMLLLKLIQDHNETCAKTNDDQRKQRLAGMITILDDVKAHMQKSQGSGMRRVAEFRRCNTELKPRMHSNAPVMPRDKKTSEAGAVTVDEIEQLRKDLNTNLTARKSLEMMCSSLGREKEFMAAELSKKVHELTELEELVDDLKAQNESLSAKVRACAAEHKERRHGGNNGGEGLDNASLQERNKELSGQLLKSLDGYRSMKRRYKDVHEKATHLRRTMDELEDNVGQGQAHVDWLRQHIEVKNGKSAPLLEELDVLEGLFGNMGLKISEHHLSRSETDCKDQDA